jgi:hypothetical protein
VTEALLLLLVIACDWEKKLPVIVLVAGESVSRAKSKMFLSAKRGVAK